MNRTALSVTILLAVAVGFSAPAQAMSPSESYLAYRKALAGAETMNDLKAYTASAKFAEMQSLPAKEKKENLGLMKIFMIEATTKLEIVSEKIEGDTAILETKYCSDAKKATSKVELVLEDGTWKILHEKSKSGLEKC